jgi:hypothetical protein
MERRFEDPRALEGEEAAVPYRPEEPEQPPSGIGAVVRQHEQAMLGIDGVEGIAAGADTVILHVRDESVAGRVPKTLDGYPVEIDVTGQIKAL